GRQGAVVTAEPTAGSVANVAQLLAGQADVAICQADVAADFDSQRADSGLRVSIGEPGSGAAFTAHRLLAAAGLVDGDLQESGLSLAAAIQALQARTI